MKEFIVVALVCTVPVIVRYLLSWEVTPYSLVWHIIAVVFVLMWQHESYK